MANLQEELEKGREKIKQSFTQPSSTQTQLLLGAPDSNELEALRAMGIASHHIQRYNDIGKGFEMSNLEARFGAIYTIEQIKKLCINYALRFVKSEHYSPIPDKDLVKKINEYAAAHPGVDVSPASLQFRIFFLASSLTFTSTKEPGPTMAFYKADSGYYVLLHQWGGEFSKWRMIWGWKYNNPFNYYLWYALLLSTVTSFIADCLRWPTWIGAILNILSFIIPAIVVISREHKFKSTEEKWDRVELYG